MKTKTQRLREIMADKKLRAKDVGALLGKSAATVRVWRCKKSETSPREIPDMEIQRLESILSPRPDK